MTSTCSSIRLLLLLHLLIILHLLLHLQLLLLMHIQLLQRLLLLLHLLLVLHLPLQPHHVGVLAMFAPHVFAQVAAWSRPSNNSPVCLIYHQFNIFFCLSYKQQLQEYFSNQNIQNMFDKRSMFWWHLMSVFSSWQCFVFNRLQFYYNVRLAWPNWVTGSNTQLSNVNRPAALETKLCILCNVWLIFKIFIIVRFDYLIS